MKGFEEFTNQLLQDTVAQMQKQEMAELPELRENPPGSEAPPDLPEDMGALDSLPDLPEKDGTISPIADLPDDSQWGADSAEPPKRGSETEWKTLAEEISTVERLKGTNPLYETGEEWNNNCQRCVPAFEMRMRGYDVTAKPCMDEFDDLSCKPFSVWHAPDVISCTTDGRSEIEAQMRQWGDGARAQVVVIWEGANGHTFTAVQENGKTRFFDPQDGNENAESYFPYVAPGRTEFCRIDNLQPSEEILECLK